MVSFAFSGNDAARSHFLRMDEKVSGLITDIKKWKDAKKVAAKKAKKAEERALKSKEGKKKAENKLAIARSKHSG